MTSIKLSEFCIRQAEYFASHINAVGSRAVLPSGPIKEWDHYYRACENIVALISASQVAASIEEKETLRIKLDEQEAKEFVDIYFKD